MAKSAVNPIDLRFELHEPQLDAINSRAQFRFYGGAAGGGRSHLTRIDFIIDALRYPGLQQYLFRRHYGDLIDNHVNGPTGFNALLAPLIKAKKVVAKELEYKFDNGSQIFLNHCQHEKDVFKNLGKEFHKLGLEESGQFTEYQIRYLLSRVRMPDAMRERIPAEERGSWPRILATSNPGGPSHDYWKTKFVDRGRELFQMAPEDGGWTAQFIPANLFDNPSINPEQYKAGLLGLKREDLVDALLHGRWDIPIGAFFPELDERKHIIPDVPILPHWFKFRTFDWGSSAPFAVLWWAVSDGTIDAIPRGALVCYREWYGASPMDRARGLALSNEQVALGIRERTGSQELIQGTVCDSLPFQSRGGRTIAEDFSHYGVPLQQGDVSPGSRIQGWQQLRSRLIGHNGVPMIYFAKSARETWRTLKQLQTDSHNPEDCDSSGEDHAPDAVSLACKARPYIREAPKDEPKTIVQAVPTMGAIIEQHLRQKAHGSTARR